MDSNVKITWNESVLQKVAEEAARRALEVAKKAALSVRCLDHGGIVRFVERDPRTGAFKIAACCPAARQVANETIRRAFR